MANWALTCGFILAAIVRDPCRDPVPGALFQPATGHADRPPERTQDRRRGSTPGLALGPCRRWRAADRVEPGPGFVARVPVASSLWVKDWCSGPAGRGRERRPCSVIRCRRMRGRRMAGSLSGCRCGPVSGGERRSRWWPTGLGRTDPRSSSPRPGGGTWCSGSRPGPADRPAPTSRCLVSSVSNGRLRQRFSDFR